MQHPVAYSMIWIVGILVVFIPLAIRQYRKATSR